MSSTLDRILLEAAAAAINFESPAHRAMAARELSNIDIGDLHDVGPNRAKLAIAICQVAVVLAVLENHLARASAAEALRLLIAAVRREPPPMRAARPAQYPYWIKR